MYSGKSWKQLEDEANKRFENLMREIRIRWITRQDFWTEFETAYTPHKRGLDKEIYLPCVLEDLRARIKIAPVFTPIEDDFPGPVERWYGAVDDHLFLLTHYYHPQYPKLTIITCETNDEAECVIMAEMRKLLAIYRT